MLCFRQKCKKLIFLEITSLLFWVITGEAMVQKSLPKDTFWNAESRTYYRLGSSFQPKHCSIPATNLANIDTAQLAHYLYTAKHQVQKLNSVSKRIVTEVAEDVEEAEVSDGRVALRRRHHLAGTVSATGLHRPRQEPVHGRRTAGQPVKT